MKTLIFTQILIALSLFSQSTPEPDYFNQPYYLNDSNQLEKIEKADAKYEVKVKGMGYGGYDMFFTALSPKSNKILSKEKSLVFLIKLNTDIDPEGYIILSKATIKSKKRLFIFDSRSMMGEAKEMKDKKIPLTVEKISDKVFKINITEKLEPGEYAFKPFSSMNLSGNAAGGLNQTIYCFGID